MQGQFPERPLLEEVIGVGVDIPQQQPYPRMPPRPTRTPPPEPTRDVTANRRRGDEDDEPCASISLARPGARVRCSGGVIGCTGRSCSTAAASIPAKGCEELIEYFSSYVKEGGDATLALMGAKLMALPEEPFIRFAGLLSDGERVQALEAATVVVCPSPYESLSLLALEAMSAGTPILANARSAVLVEHCVRATAACTTRTATSSSSA